MITRYAYIDPDTGEALWGPGPMPYFITLKDGTWWEITAHSVEESEAVGVFVVDQVNYREPDVRFEAALIPDFTIENGRPKETWSYEFIPAARNNMISGVDEHAENLRSIIATRYAGQFEEYNQVYSEALAVAALPVDQEITAGQYPFLEADVNVTFSEPLNRVVSTIREAATLVIERREIWKLFGANLRKARLLAKKEITEAADDAAALVIFRNFESSVAVDYLQ